MVHFELSQRSLWLERSLKRAKELKRIGLNWPTPNYWNSSQQVCVCECVFVCARRTGVCVWKRERVYVKSVCPAYFRLRCSYLLSAKKTVLLSFLLFRIPGQSYFLPSVFSGNHGIFYLVWKPTISIQEAIFMIWLIICETHLWKYLCFVTSLNSFL